MAAWDRIPVILRRGLQPTLEPHFPRAVGPPQVDSDMAIRVLASVIQRNQRLLVCRRPRHKRHGGLWEFPGGKVKDGETDLETARRELKEELGVHGRRG